MSKRCYLKFAIIFSLFGCANQRIDNLPHRIIPFKEIKSENRKYSTTVDSMTDQKIHKAMNTSMNSIVKDRAKISAILGMIRI